MTSTRTRATGRDLRFDSLEQEAFLSLWRTYDRLRALEDELFSRYELSPQQYNVLRLLKAEHPDPLPTLALADRLVSNADFEGFIVDGGYRRPELWMSDGWARVKAEALAGTASRGKSSAGV